MTPEVETGSRPTLSVSFSDFWPGFDPDENFLVNVLRGAFDLRVTSSAPLRVFGPYGGEHRRHRGPKIFCTGEPWTIPSRGFDFSIGWWDDGNRAHARVPQSTWNLLRYPGEYERLAERTFANWVDRPHFCNFVYSNGGPRLRREFFHALAARRFVHAPGNVETNSPPIDGGRVAPDWWRRKLDYLQGFRFTIAFESVRAPGYTTEKLFDPLVTGGIPIYWGNEAASADAQPSTYINAADFSSLDELADYVVALDDDRQRARTLFSEAPFAPRMLEALEREIVRIFRAAADDSGRARLRRSIRGLAYRAVDAAPSAAVSRAARARR